MVVSKHCPSFWGPLSSGSLKTLRFDFGPWVICGFETLRLDFGPLPKSGFEICTSISGLCRMVVLELCASITNGDDHWRQADNRVTAQLKNISLKVMPEMLTKGARFYEGSETVNVGCQDAVEKNQWALRVRQPWVYGLIPLSS